jgi:metal-responsive CopG/Arc/MetJ family transcriptional regulator
MKEKGGHYMKENKKEKVGIWMKPDMVKRIDAAYPLHEISSRSEFVCKAIEFYLGFLQTENSTEYINKTTLAFLENQLVKLEARVCRQLFRMCVEQSMIANISASQIKGMTDELMAALRKKCVKDVKNTIGNIRYDNIYDYQHPELHTEDDEYEQGN